MTGYCEPNLLLVKKKQTLILVLLINCIMFIAQFTAALFAGSSALFADSFDMLGDALAYSLSLYVINKDNRWLAKAALFKGSLIVFFGLLVVVEVIWKIFSGEFIPSAPLMLIFGMIGLLANAICFYLLTAHRHQDINMTSVWICSRNDIIGNLAVLLTAGLVWLTHNRWPDIIVGFGLGCVLLRSGIQVLRQARKELLS